MRIIMSFWSAPSRVNDNIRFNGGWINSKYHWMSWVLSLMAAKEHYDSIELYTDNIGKHILIDQLNLPFDKVHLSLNSLDINLSRYWNAGKVYTYSIQSEPFCHIDSDVFLWKKLPEKFNSFNFATQNKELIRDYTYYHNFLDFIVDTDQQIYVPKEFESEILSFNINKSYAANMGIYYCNDLQFNKLYTKNAFDFLLNNKDIFEKFILNGSSVLLGVPIVFEQYILTATAKYNNVLMDVLFDTADFNANFLDYYLERCETYSHCLGDAKQDSRTYNKLEQLVKSNFPDYYDKIMKLDI